MKTCISCPTVDLYDLPANTPKGWQCTGCRLWAHVVGTTPLSADAPATLRSAARGNDLEKRPTVIQRGGEDFRQAVFYYACNQAQIRIDAKRPGAAHRMETMHRVKRLPHGGELWRIDW